MRSILIFFALVMSFFVVGQTLPDFNSIDVNSLSDQQIENYLKTAQAAGYSDQDLIALAKSQGLGDAELSLLQDRFASFKSKRLSQSSDAPLEVDRLRKPYEDSLEYVRGNNSSRIYGLDIFRRGSSLSFQTNDNIPTPLGYKLGTGDELFIDIYGKSENYYQTKVTPDGTIVLENLGPIAVSGLTIDEARKRIKAKFGKIYQGLNSNSGETNISVSLGQVRSVSVNVIGQVELPGTYTLSALNTAFNALYAAGGITELGTLREVKHLRGGQLITSIDIYEYLQNGFTAGDTRLESGDVILVQPYTNRISLTGAVKIPGRFELLDGETLSSLLTYSGGFTENAFQKTVKLKRFQNGEKLVADINSDQFEIFNLQTGDEIEVGLALNRYSNRVVLQGAVFRPGNYSITSGLTLRELLIKANGIRPDALMRRGLIIRTKSDLTTESIPFDLNEVINSSTDIELQREDVVTIFSKNQMEGEEFVEVLGEVNQPSLVPFSQNLSLYDALLLSKGISNAADGGYIEVSRRQTSNENDGFTLAEVTTFSVGQDGSLDTDAKGFQLSAYDKVVVRRNPDYQRQEFVAIEGQVKSPGQFALQNQGERISDLLTRAGGIRDFAFIEGATLIRRTEFYNEPSDIEVQIDELYRLQEKFNKSPELLTESEQSLISRIENDINALNERKESNQSLSSFAKRERIKELIERNTLNSSIELKQAEPIGIDLNEILSNPGSISDLLLQDGDVLVIPKRSETVRLRGKLIYPTTSRFIEGKSLKHYIDNAGGFDYRAKRKGTYVVYANGEVARTKSFLFFKFYPKPKAGSEIIVPTKPLKVPIRIQDVVAITSGLATLVLVVNQITNNAN